MLPMMSEKYKVTLVVERYNSPTTEVRYLRKQWLEKPERKQKHNTISNKKSKTIMKPTPLSNNWVYLPTRFPKRVVKLVKTSSGSWLVGFPWFWNQILTSIIKYSLITFNDVKKRQNVFLVTYLNILP